MAKQSFEEQIADYVKNAPEATGGTFIQYGKLTCSVNRITFKGKGNPPEKTPYKQDMEVDSKKNQFLEVEFIINIQELNPSLQYEDWTRRIQIKKSSKTAKTDWSETVLPSLEKVFGKKWIDVVSGEQTPYVECEQAPSQYVRAGAKDYGVPKFLRVFKNKDECTEARNERYGEPVEDGGELGIPESVIEQAEALLVSMKGNRKKVKTMMEDSEPFNKYDIDAIFAEIDAKEE